MKTTSYFDFSVRQRRPEIRMEWVEKALNHPEHKEVQPNGRVRHYIYIEEW